MSKLSAEGVAYIQAQALAYEKLCEEACARGEHNWMTPKEKPFFPAVTQRCKHCGRTRNTELPQERHYW